MEELRVHLSSKPKKVYASTTQYKSNIETNPIQRIQFKSSIGTY